ncbi:MAG: MraY family glycosyltransferase [Planctomycetota bacterium]
MLGPIAETGGITFAISVVLTGLCVLVGRRLNALDAEGSAGHAKSMIRRVPNIGGVAILASILAGLVIHFAPIALATHAPLPDGLPSAEEQLQSGVSDRIPMGVTLIACLLVLHVVGVVDDRRPLPALPKLGVMLGLGLVFPIFFDTRLFEFLDAPLGGAWASIGLTALWFVAVTNAMNFMDNMDGLSGGTAVVAAALFLVAAITGEQWFIAATLAVLIGAVGGFLVWNLPPAKIFMGDGGSLVIGFLLAFLTVRTTYFTDTAAALEAAGVPLESIGTLTQWEGVDEYRGWHAVFMPLCVLAVPLYDLVAVSVVRLSQGKSPMVGDEQHFSHRLRRRGLTVRQTLVVVYALSAVTGIAGVLLTAVEDAWLAALCGGQVIVILAAMAVFEFGSRTREPAT